MAQRMTSARLAAMPALIREAPEDSARSAPVRGVGDELDPGDGWKLAVTVQPRDRLTVGLLKCLHDLLVVLKGLGRLAPSVHEGPDRGLPGLHVRIIAVPQHIDLREHPFREGRPELSGYGVRYSLVHAVLLGCKSSHAANDYSVTVSG
jgi:hypothetical protein